MKKQSYQERVQALAEKMAREKYKHSSLFKYKDDEKYPKTNETIVREISDMLPVARIAVAEVAEGIILYAYDGDIRAYKRHEPNGGYVTNYLKEQGLIPDDGQVVNLEYDPKGSVHNPDNPEPEQEAGSDD